MTRPWQRYLLAIVAVGLATLISFPIQRAGGGRVPFIAFFPVVTVIAALAGFGPGLLAVVLSGVAVMTFWMAPFGRVAVHSSADIVALCAYIVGCVVTTYVGGSLRSAHLGRRRSEDLLQAVVDNVPGIIYLKDRSGVLRLVNRRYAELAGRPVETIIGKSDRDAFGDTLDFETIRANDQKVLASRRMLHLEEKLRHADGEHTYLSIKVPVEHRGETLLCGFTTDITERKRGEVRERFLLTLEDTLRPLTSPHEITHTAARLLGEHLGVDRCAYATVEADENTFIVTGDFNRPGIPSIVGQYKLEDFGAEALRLHRLGQPYVVEDVKADPQVTHSDLGAYEQTKIRAVVAVPLNKSGRFVAGMAVHQATPREWRTDEVELVRTVAARCWESIERSRITVELRENEECLRVAQEAGGFGTFDYDVTSGRSRGSETFYRIFDAPPDSATYDADAWVRIVHPDDRDRVFTDLQSNLRINGPSEAALDYRLRLPDGTIRWVSYHGRITRDPQGRALRILGTVSDTTATVVAQEALRQSEARFRALSDDAPVAISVSRVGKQLYVNAAYRRCFGISADIDVVGASIFEQIAPESRDQLARNVERRNAGQTVDNTYQFTGLRADGSRFTVEVQVGQIELPDGPASIAFLIDVTDRNRAQEGLRLLADAGALLNSTNPYEQLLQELASLVVPRLADWCAVDMLQGDGTLRRVAVVHPEPAKIELAHELHRRYPPDPDAPVGTWQIIRTGQTACVEVVTDEMIAASAVDDYHLRVMRDLKLRSYIGVPLMARGRVLGVLTLIYAESGRTYTQQDVSLAEDLARRAAIAVDNATLFDAERAARGEAERASRLKDEFLATLSHELRTPLNAILGWSQLLSSHNGNRPDDLAEGLRTIERNARAQTQLIEDLLDMSRIVSGKLRLDVQSVNPPDVVTSAVASITPAADAKGIDIDTDLDPAAGPIRGDPNRLQQVVWNLLTNAVKFTPGGGSIRVAVRRVGAQVEISVSDTGQGITAEFIPFMFERFRQADASITRRHGGLGIGLSLVKQLVDLHGGTVSVESPGTNEGATFTVRLPIAVAQARFAPDAGMTEEALPSKPVGPSLDGLRVLVVDDEPDARMLAKRILEERGARVTSAGSAKEALALLRATPPDVLLSDIGMPDHDGYQFITWIRSLSYEEGAQTPAAAFTAFARPEDRQRALDAGYQSHVVKPVEPDDLVNVVARLAGRTAGVTAENAAPQS
ncbi:MAG TPA: PAS domain S-box protein [Tepidisphaeraceae bacterium]